MITILFYEMGLGLPGADFEFLNFTSKLSPTGIGYDDYSISDPAYVSAGGAKRKRRRVEETLAAASSEHLELSRKRLEVQRDSMHHMKAAIDAAVRPAQSVTTAQNGEGGSLEIDDL